MEDLKPKGMGSQDSSAQGASGLREIEERMKRIKDNLASLESALDLLRKDFKAAYFALKLPEPIATPLAREQSAVLFQEKFSHLLDVGESCVKYTAAVISALQYLDPGNLPRRSPLFGKPV